jgi:hypothetical protein
MGGFCFVQELTTSLNSQRINLYSMRDINAKTAADCQGTSRFKCPPDIRRISYNFEVNYFN